MKFADPYMLYLMWGMAAVIGVIIYGNRKRTRILSRFAGPRAQEEILADYNPGRHWTRGMLMAGVLILLVITLAGPQWGFRWETIEQKGVDVMICLDCSRSMLAQDIEPTRLERAKREIIDLLRMMKTDRAGLVAFAGGAILQCPLTLDHEAFNIFLQALEPDYLPVGGTDLAGAIETALNGFEAEVDSEKAIILITDGEDTAGRKPLEAAAKAAEAGVRIYCIGVGSEDGAPVPDRDGGFKKDAAGTIVLSRVDGQGLKTLAATGNGVYVRSVAGDMDLDVIYTREIQGTMEQKTLASSRKKVWENRFQWFLFPAILLLMLQMAIPDKANKARFLGLMFLAFMLVAGHAGTSRAGASASVREGIDAYSQGIFDEAEKHFIDAQLDRPDMAELYYNIGTAAYKKGDFESALKQFTRAMETEDEALKNKARYNSGNAAYKLGQLEKAAGIYEEALKADPQDTQAKENLELVRKKMEEQKNQPQDQQDSTDSKDKKDNDGDQAGQQDQQNQDQQNKQQGQDQQAGQSGNTQQQDQQGTDEKPQPQQGQKPDEKKQGSKEAADREQEQASKPASGDSSGEKDQGRGETPAMGQDRMLNRLKDEPGKALFPAYQERKIDKDW